MAPKRLEGSPARVAGPRVSRRSVLATAGGGIASGLPVRSLGAAPEATPAADWDAFDQAVAEAMTTFDVVGAAVAVVTADGIAYSNAFGVADLDTGAAVTTDTHFLAASVTKSMTSLLVATFVDEGAFGWDDPVIDLWPDFRAPTAELTATLRVRDLLGMASGLGEPPAMSTFHQGDPTAIDLARSLALLPVIGPTGGAFFYNNTVYALGGYLPALLQGTTGDALAAAFVTMLTERVYRPVGMATARVGDDPRPVVADFATGYAPDLALGTAPERYAPVGSYAPVGGALVSISDMANYAIMQVNGGISVDGARVVSAGNLAACWTAQIEMPYSRADAPDLERLGYGMGWTDATYRGGRRAHAHSGGIDGFSSHIMILPGENLGLVVLSNVGPYPRGQAFTSHIPNLLLNARFGINRDLLDAGVAAYRDAAWRLDELAARAGAVDAAAIAPWLGHYERGWSLALDAAGEARLRQGARSFRLLAMPDDGYVMAGGVLPGTPVHATRDANGAPGLEIAGFETVRWTVGEHD